MPSTTPALLTPEIHAYLLQHQCAPQWRSFLHAMGAEFRDALQRDELRELMHRIGMKFAVQHPLPACETLTSLQEEMAAFWRPIGWGWVSLTQDSMRLSIHHHCAPLASAFGADHGEWTHGFLQGVYQQWFDAAGAHHLRVGQAAITDAWGSARFELSA